MENKELIKKGFWSTCYHDGHKFRKYYNYYMPKAVLREKLASKTVEEAGIVTPHFHNIENNGTKLCAIFDFVNMRPISRHMLTKNQTLQNGISIILENIAKIKWNNNDNYWSEYLLPEFLKDLRILPISDISYYIMYLESLEPLNFIHGDFSLGNINYHGDQLVLFDFQHSCLGPVGWDRAYLAATLFRKESSFLRLTLQEERMAEIISAIRWGRNYMKNRDVTLRKSIWQSWHNKK